MVRGDQHRGCPDNARPVILPDLMTLSKDSFSNCPGDDDGSRKLPVTVSKWLI